MLNLNNLLKKLNFHLKIKALYLKNLLDHWDWREIGIELDYSYSQQKIVS